MTRFKEGIALYKAWQENDFLDRDRNKIDERRLAALDLEIVEDLNKYNRASRPEFIEDFKAWVVGPEPGLEVNDEERGLLYGKDTTVPWQAKFPYAWHKRAEDPQYLDSPRYRFFIQVDQECVESVLALDEPKWGEFSGRYNGWVNIVNSIWPLAPEWEPEDVFRPAADDPDIEFDNGCWFRAAPCYRLSTSIRRALQ